MRHWAAPKGGLKAVKTLAEVAKQTGWPAASLRGLKRKGIIAVGPDGLWEAKAIWRVLEGEKKGQELDKPIDRQRIAKARLLEIQLAEKEGKVVRVELVGEMLVGLGKEFCEGHGAIRRGLAEVADKAVLVVLDRLLQEDGKRMRKAVERIRLATGMAGK